eukprot:TRINITY_DN48583_c0_g1_i1.p1 TRINITY_DN48583_c0_g1~~TRINITY_DN48583_c0_g1_i1.p1  ORF type:complete len:405 (-),score=47.95 TRINITY_DN48583_c0_g1_i1:217-1431(-)
MATGAMWSCSLNGLIRVLCLASCFVGGLLELTMSGGDFGYGSSVDATDLGGKNELASAVVIGSDGGVVRSVLPESGAGKRGTVGPTQRMQDGGVWGPSHWTLSKNELALFVADCRNSTSTRLCRCSKQWNEAKWSMHDFVDHCVMPTTNGSGLGLALKIKSDLGVAPRKVSLMTSHSWIANVAAFFRDVLHYMQDDDEVFICSLGVDQFRKGCQVGTDPLASPFVTVIKSAKESHNGRMLIIPNDVLMVDGKGLYSRGWCILEMYVAWNRSLPVEVMRWRESDKYLFGGPLDGRLHSTRNLALAQSLPNDLEAVKRLIEVWPPVPATDLRAAAKHARGQMQDGGKVGDALEAADSWTQLDFIIKGAAAGHIKKPLYNKQEFLQTLCLRKPSLSGKLILVPCRSR